MDGWFVADSIAVSCFSSWLLFAVLLAMANFIGSGCQGRLHGGGSWCLPWAALAGGDRELCAVGGPMGELMAFRTLASRLSL